VVISPRDELIDGLTKAELRRRDRVRHARKSFAAPGDRSQKIYDTKLKTRAEEEYERVTSFPGEAS